MKNLYVLSIEISQKKLNERAGILLVHRILENRVRNDEVYRDEQSRQLFIDRELKGVIRALEETLEDKAIISIEEINSRFGERLLPEKYRQITRINFLYDALKAYCQAKGFFGIETISNGSNYLGDLVINLACIKPEKLPKDRWERETPESEYPRIIDAIYRDLRNKQGLFLLPRD